MTYDESLERFPWDSNDINSCRVCGKSTRIYVGDVDRRLATACSFRCAVELSKQRFGEEACKE